MGNETRGHSREKLEKGERVKDKEAYKQVVQGVSNDKDTRKKEKH